jgi:hypothetical protein
VVRCFPESKTWELIPATGICLPAAFIPCPAHVTAHQTPITTHAPPQCSHIRRRQRKQDTHFFVYRVSEWAPLLEEKEPGVDQVAPIQRSPGPLRPVAEGILRADQTAVSAINVRFPDR